MKYGIKLKNKLDTNGTFKDNPLKSQISEHTGSSNEKTLVFSSVEEAELFAKEKNINNYTIEIIIE